MRRRTKLSVALDAIDQSNYKRAIFLLQEHLADDSEDGRALAHLARCLLDEWQTFSALAISEEALKHAPANPFCHIIRARVAEEMDDPDTNISAIDEALRLDPSHIGALQRLGYRYVYYADAENLRRVAHRLIAAEPDVFQGHLFMSQAETLAGNGPKAEAHARDALRIDASAAANHAAIGWAFWLQKKLKEAREAALSALAINPEYFDAHILLITLTHEKKRISGFLHRQFARAFNAGIGTAIRYGAPAILLFFLLQDTFAYLDLSSAGSALNIIGIGIVVSALYSWWSFSDMLEQHGNEAKLKTDY